jgi:Acetyltransferase (GNAT) family.
VARQGDKVVGFGSIVPKHSELQAVYVHPRVGRTGVGTRILGILEDLALSLGVERLQIDASLNAETFYVKQGV